MPSSSAARISDRSNVNKGARKRAAQSKKISVVCRCFCFCGDGYDVRHVDSHVSQRNAVEQLQASLGIGNANPAPFFHRRESIFEFPWDGHGSDQRMTRGHRDNRVPLGLTGDHCDECRCVNHNVQFFLLKSFSFVQLSRWTSSEPIVPIALPGELGTSSRDDSQVVRGLALKYPRVQLVPNPVM